MKHFKLLFGILFIVGLSSFVLLTEETPMNDLDGKTFVIQSAGPVANGRVIDADGYALGKNGTKIQLWEKNGIAHQNWKFIASGKGNDTYYIISMSPRAGVHKYLDANFSDLSKNGGIVQLWEDNRNKNGAGEPNQLWKVTKNGNGSYRIASAHPTAQGKSLDADGYTQSKNGGKVQIWQPLSNKNQEWNLIAQIPMVAMPDLIGHWTFENDSLLDLMNNFAPLTRHGNVQVIDGKLKVGNNAYATSKSYTGPTFKEKTLVAWAKIDNPNSGGGSILTIGKPTSNYDFDAIVYAERQTKVWMAGSGWFHRTQDLGSKAQETTPNDVVQIAITYGDKNGQADIKIYRNGQLLGAYTKGKMLNWTEGQTGVLFGLRHFFNGLPGKPFVEASIEEARIYSGVLTQEQISKLKTY